MFKYISQNKHIIMVAITLFVVSMSTLMFFLGLDNNLQQHDYKTDVIDSIMKVKSPQEQERKYRKLVHNEQDSIIVLNLDSTIEFVSWDFETVFGFSQDEVLHTPFYNLLHPDDLPIFLSGFGEVLKNKQTVNVVGPYRMKDKKSSYHVLVSTAVPVMENHTINHIVIVTRDISKSLEDQEKSTSNEKKIRDRSNEDNARLMAEKVEK